MGLYLEDITLFLGFAILLTGTAVALCRLAWGLLDFLFRIASRILLLLRGRFDD